MQTGVDKIEIFDLDLNNDNVADRITKTHWSNISAHEDNEYNIELNQNRSFTSVKKFRTVIGAEATLTLFYFNFKPSFAITKISRPLKESFATPTLAVKTIYKLIDNKIVPTETQTMSETIDVTELF